MSAGPLFSVLTPTWQRASYLPDVWNSLKAQSFRSFEWIVGNDGSSDDTREVVERLAAQSDFKVVLVDADSHVGKSRIDNEMVRVASGELCLWCDSDDMLLHDALGVLARAWNDPSLPERDGVIGVGALCEADGGVLGAVKPSEGTFVRTLYEVNASIAADSLLSVRTEVLRRNPFPEVDLHIPESSIWERIGRDRILFVPHVLKHVRYRSDHAISFSGRLKFCRGRAHDLAAGQRISHIRRTTFAQAMRTANFVRYCIHGDIGPREAWAMWPDTPGRRIGLLACGLPGGMLALRDIIRGVVDKTHVEFERTRMSATIEARVLSDLNDSADTKHMSLQ